jgi:hypothetical protein
VRWRFRGAVWVTLGDQLIPVGRVDVGRLVKLTGRWPLLVRLASRRLAADLVSGVSASAAVAGLVERLAAEGPTTLDVADPNSRGSRRLGRRSRPAWSSSSRPSGSLLAQLGIFAEDVDVPRDARWSADEPQ